MRDMNIYQGGELLPADLRRSSRSISRLQGHGLVQQAATDIETDGTLARIDAVTTTTGYGMTAVTRVAQAQTALEQLAPQVSGRLNLLADQHTLDVADVLSDLRRRLRRP